MKKITLLFSFIGYSLLGMAQDNCPYPSATYTTQGNNIQAILSNGGHPFAPNFNSNNFVSTVNNDQQASTIFTSGLWIGGIDPGANLKLSATNYHASSYHAGPIGDSPLPDSTTCINWDKIWGVTKNQIESHQADFADNGVIDTPILEIFSWPANGNSDFETIEGFPLPESDATLAPFFDINQDGIYQPESGEYPLPNNVSEDAIPEEITYCLFNSAAVTEFDPTLFQIGQTTYSYDCDGNNPLNNTLFVSFQLTNKGLEDIDSLYCGMFVDFDLGCHYDDYIGSDSNSNSFFAYNSDNLDGIGGVSCDGTPTFGEAPPVQSVTFLNQPLSIFTYHTNGGQNGIIGTQDPDLGIEYYRYLTGSWKDGSPFEFGGDGYQEGTNPVSHAFSDDPNNADGWSMTSTTQDELDRRAVGSTKISKIEPNQSFSLDLAFTYVREPDANHLENVTAMYDHIDEVQAAYDNQFLENCMPTAVTNVPAYNHNFKVFPNPTTDKLSIEFSDITLKTIRIIDVTGKIILEKNGQFSNDIQLNLNQFSKGIYFLQMENETQRFYEKISVQ